MRQFLNKIIFGTEDISLLPKLKSSINKSNLKSLYATSAFLGALMLCMSVISVFFQAFHHNFILYILCFIVCLVSFVLTKAVVPHTSKIITPVFYMLIATGFAFGITLGNFNETVSTAVTFNVILVAFPFLICDVPWRINVLLVAAYVVFEITSYYQKPAEMFTYDLVNGTSFLLLAVFINTFEQIRHMEDFNNGLIVKRQRDTDALTGTLTKKALEITIRKSLLQTEISGALMIVDIDNFKNVNDRYGHAIGDYFIAATAKSLLSVCRTTDTVGRFGGDEFVLFFPGMNSRPLVELKAKEVSDAVSETASKGFVNEEITVCIGCTYFSNVHAPYEDLFNQMDTALYRAKNTGKNKCVIFG